MILYRIRNKKGEFYAATIREWTSGVRLNTFFSKQAIACLNLADLAQYDWDLVEYELVEKKVTPVKRLALIKGI